MHSYIAAEGLPSTDSAVVGAAVVAQRSEPNLIEDQTAGQVFAVHQETVVPDERGQRHSHRDLEGVAGDIVVWAELQDSLAADSRQLAHWKSLETVVAADIGTVEVVPNVEVQIAVGPHRSCTVAVRQEPGPAPGPAPPNRSYPLDQLPPQVFPVLVPFLPLLPEDSHNFHDCSHLLGDDHPVKPDLLRRGLNLIKQITQKLEFNSKNTMKSAAAMTNFLPGEWLR